MSPFVYNSSTTSFIVTIAFAGNPYFSVITCKADLSESKDFSILFKETISPTIVILSGEEPWAFTIGYVSSIDFPDVVTSSIMITLSPSVIGLPKMLPLSAPVLLKNTNIVYGTVTDDDGISEFKYRIGDTGDFTAITVSNGSWNQSFDDGLSTIYFYVKDTEGKEFTSSATAGPKLYDGTNKYGITGKVDTRFFLKVDTANPVYSDLQYDTFSKATNDYVGIFRTDYSLGKFGGDTTKFKVTLKAKDANAIKSVTATIGSNVYPGVCADASHDDAENHIWTISDIDVHSLASGSYNCVITVTDGCALFSTATMTISVDNTEPVIEIIKPSTQISNAEVIRGTVDSTATIYYAVSRVDNTEPGNAAVTNQSTAWAKEDYASLSWNVYFDGAEVTGQTHTSLFRKYISELGITTEASITSGTYKDITKLYVWIKAVDECGNVSTKVQAVSIDPQGNRPKLTVSYPDNDTILGGTVRIYGTVTDDLAGKYVWIQLDTNEDGYYKAEDVSNLKGYGYTIGEITSGDTVSDVSGVTDDTAKNYAIKVTVSGVSWNQSVNANGEFNPSDDGKKDVKMWISATDAENNQSVVDERKMIIDKGSPIIDQSKLNLVQYETSSGSGVACIDGTVKSGTIVASQAFTEGMSVKGVWFLTGTITDASGIKKIVKDDITVVETAGGSTAEFTPDVNNNYTMNIPLGSSVSDSVGESSVHIVATENTDTGLWIEKTFSVKYDNKKPEIVTTEDDGLNINANITNSNGFYKLASVAKEKAVNNVDQTGVERIAFYFTRDITATTTHDLYDVMIKNGETGNALSSYTTSLTKDEGLYWKTISITKVAGDVITLSSDDDNVHIGGLAKVNGVIYRITAKSGNTRTLSGQPGAATTASFALANVIDNTTTEGTGKNLNDAGYYTDSFYDDGDLMIESLNKQGTTYYWEAYINSKNIPDGPVNVHYVVFDKAGNFNEGPVIEAFVKNNQPRIVGIKIGTDDNGNETIDDSEFVTTWSGLYEKGYDDNDKKVTETTFPGQTNGLKSAITAKGLTVIKPEIVGGNGDIGYTYQAAKNLTETTWADAYCTNTTLTNLGSGRTDDTLLDLSDIKLTVEKLLTDGVDDGNNQKFTFKIWDSTAGTTSGTDSQYATINVIMNVAYKDKTPPTNYIKPFFWNKNSDNSLYENSKENGHIELPADLPSTFMGDAITDTTINAKRPKVSGKIKIEGIARDNNFLDKISATLENFGGSFGNGGTIVLAAYENGAWNPMNSSSLEEWDAEVSKATYSELLKAGYITQIPSGKDGTDTVEYNTQEYGSVVHWTLNLDTSKVTSTAHLANLISVSATDKGCPSLPLVNNKAQYTPNTFVATTGQTGGANGSGNLTSQYKIDIVPYITKVTTSLSSLKSKNPSVYSRTALGHYPVRSDSSETFTVSGFNLGSISPVATSSIKTGEYSITVNGIKTFNNMNSDNAKGAYTGTTLKHEGDYSIYSNYYNREPNNDNNNILTDDIYFDVWDINSSAVQPISGMIEQPVMKINPKTDKVGFAFVNGPLYFSMGGEIDSTEYSSMYWMGSYDFFTSVGFTYDALGYSYGCAAGGDINSSQADKFQLMSSRWGIANHNSEASYGNTNSRRLETIAQKESGTGTIVFNKQRIKSPSFATSVNGNETNLYLAYYDDMNEEVRFKAGTTGTTTTINYEIPDSVYKIKYVDNQNNSWKYGHITLSENVSYYLENGDLITFCDKDGNPDSRYTETYKVADIGHNGSDYWFKLKKNNDSDYTPFPSYNASNAATHCKDNTYIKIKTKATTPTLNSDFGSFVDYDKDKNPYPYRHDTVSMIAGSDTGKNAGEYVSIAVDSKDGEKVVAVWYDSTARKLQYAYNKTPTTNRNGDTTGIGWTYIGAVFSGDMENAGEYCQIAVDNDGGIHIAAYDPINLDLVYAYAPSYDGTFTTCVVDGSGVVGSNLTLDVAKSSSGNWIPYIGYYATSCIKPKYAYKTDIATDAPEGSIDDTATGLWETTIIPTAKTIFLGTQGNSKINVGVWKNTSGVIKNSPTVSGSNKHIGSSYEATCYDQVGSNGTTNAILGYAIKNTSSSGYIETAQIMPTE